PGVGIDWFGNPQASLDEFLADIVND
ncbi:MAG: hypothetical protein K0Q78_408, partial [Cellvibrio sp.]|nr:hypothetical protein [Cellvibrio sp.]